jgi:RNA polymerase sigma-70 factor (ECF subfamily)
MDFPPTSWASVLAARDGSERSAHLDRLFKSYWVPVFLYVRRAWSKSDEEARDLTQEFFLRLLQTDFLKDVSPEKGRFRAYLKACLRHFLLDARKFAKAEKRGGDARLFSIEGSEKPVEIAAPTPEESFDLEWAYALLQAALPSLEQTLKSLHRELAWTLFRAIDVDATPDSRPTYAGLATLHHQPEQKVKSEIDYARKTLRKLVLAKIRDYTLTDDDASAELRELFPG